MLRHWGGPERGGDRRVAGHPRRNGEVDIEPGLEPAARDPRRSVMNAMSDEQPTGPLGQAMQRQSLQDVPPTPDPAPRPRGRRRQTGPSPTPDRSRRWLHRGIGVAAAAAVVTAVVPAPVTMAHPRREARPPGQRFRRRRRARPPTPRRPPRPPTTGRPAVRHGHPRRRHRGAAHRLERGPFAQHPRRRDHLVPRGRAGNCRVTFHRYDVVGYGGPGARGAHRDDRRHIEVLRHRRPCWPGPHRLQDDHGGAAGRPSTGSGRWTARPGP